MNRIAAIAILGITLLAGAVQAQIYKSTDEQGNVVYSDTPPAGAGNSEQITVSPTNTTPPPPAIAPLERRETSAKEPETKPLEVIITSPANEATIPMGGGNFSVSASLSSEGNSDQLLQLIMDGAPQGEPQSAGVWNLENVLRGPHDLVVEARSRNGEVLARSEPIRVYVLRPSIR